MSEQAGEKRTDILLIGPYSLLRESLGCWLSADPGFKVAAQCSSAAEALEILKLGPVDVVLLDFDVGDSEIKQFVRTIGTRGLKPKLLLLTSVLNYSDAADLIRAGISGIFQKNDSAALLGHAIRDVAGGNLWFRQEALAKVLNCDEGTAAHTLENQLSRRQFRVLILVSEGLSNREIGLQIGVSEGSVKATVRQLFLKFGVRSRSQLVRLGMEQVNTKHQLYPT